MTEENGWQRVLLPVIHPRHWRWTLLWGCLVLGRHLVFTVRMHPYPPLQVDHAELTVEGK